MTMDATTPHNFFTPPESTLTSGPPLSPKQLSLVGFAEVGSDAAQTSVTGKQPRHLKLSSNLATQTDWLTASNVAYCRNRVMLAGSVAFVLPKADNQAAPRRAAIVGSLAKRHGSCGRILCHGQGQLKDGRIDAGAGDAPHV